LCGQFEIADNVKLVLMDGSSGVMYTRAPVLSIGEEPLVNKGTGRDSLTGCHGRSLSYVQLPSASQVLRVVGAVVEKSMKNAAPGGLCIVREEFGAIQGTWCQSSFTLNVIPETLT